MRTIDHHQCHCSWMNRVLFNLNYGITTCHLINWIASYTAAVHRCHFSICLFLMFFFHFCWCALALDRIFESSIIDERWAAIPVFCRCTDSPSTCPQTLLGMQCFLLWFTIFIHICARVETIFIKLSDSIAHNKWALAHNLFESFGKHRFELLFFFFAPFNI